MIFFILCTQTASDASHVLHRALTLQVTCDHVDNAWSPHEVTCDNVRPHEVTLRHWWHRREWGRHIIVTRAGATRQSSHYYDADPHYDPGVWHWHQPSDGIDQTPSVATPARPGCQGRIRVTPKHWWLALGEQRIMILKLLNLLTTSSNTIIHGQLWLPSAASNLETHTSTSS